jgi:Na+/melibiose symporter-like transporter
MTSFLSKLNHGSWGLLEKIGMAGNHADAAGCIFGITNILGQLASIVGIVISNLLVSRMGKRNVFIGGLFLATLFAALFYVIPPTGIGWVLLLQVLYNLSWGITMPVPWAMMADVADYSDWKYSRRSTAIVFAGIVIGLKVGLAIGGAIGSLLLKWSGYVAPPANVSWIAQTPAAISGIRLSTSLYPAIAIAIVIILLFFYKINKSMETRMQDELAERRKAYNK